MHLLRLVLAATVALVAAALTLVPPPAAAEPAFYEVEYDVKVELTANWSIEKEDVDEYPKRTMGGDAEVKVVGSIENVLFRNGKLLPQQPGGYLTIQQPSGGGSWERRDWDSVKKTEIVSKGTCGPAIVTEGTPAYVRRTESQPNPNAERLNWRLATAVPVGFNCPDLTAGADLAGSVVGLPGVMDTTFELPLEAIGMGTIIQHVSARDEQRTPINCPDRGDHVAGCAFTWSAKLTFNRTGEWQYDGDLGGEQPPVHGPHIDPRAEAIMHAVDQYGKDEPAPTPHGPQFDPRADAIIRAVEQYGQELRFEASCPSGCDGTAEVLPGRMPLTAREVIATAAARKALAKLKFKVKPSTTAQKVKLKLPRKARAALRKAGGAKVKVTLKPKRGPAQVKTLTLRQKRR